MKADFFVPFRSDRHRRCDFGNGALNDRTLSNLYTTRPSSRREAEWRTNGKTFIYIGVRNRRTSR